MPSKERYVSVSPLLVPVEKTFDYVVPDNLRESVTLGSMVLVPFGRRRIFGMVVRISDIKPDRELKPVEGIVDDFKTVQRDLLSLCIWISRMYLCPLNLVMEAAFPFHRKMSAHGIEKHAFQDLQRRTVLEKYVVILQDALKLAEENNFEEFKNAPAQRRVLRALLDEGGGITTHSLMENTGASMQTIKELEKKGMVAIDYVPKDMEPSGDADNNEDHFELNPTQEHAYKEICRTIEPQKHKVFLLQGVTSSGKTEIYMHAVRCCIEKRKKVILLVPEIALGTQIISRFLRRFAGHISVWHSSLSMTERLYEWNRITSGESNIVIGARSAIFAPLSDIGLIIVDEEHESAYKQESAPRYNAREAAIQRAKLIGCPIVLGSATPSLEMVHLAHEKQIEYLFLPHRIGKSQLPEIKVVDMRKVKASRTTSMFSDQLIEAIRANLEKKEQTMVFLNHRGYAQYVQCFKCGESLICPQCTVSMKYHKEEQAMKCHLCGYSEPVPPTCPSCGSKALRYYGFGTERVFNQLKRGLHGTARIERMDRDTMSRKGEYHRIITAFEEHEIDILVGTQMIAKGLDFPGVTLVGVVSADSVINMPDFRSGERTFQLLMQVSGRAGRRDIPGTVIIQTFNPDHPSIRAVKDQNSLEFYDYELQVRKEALYPPYTHMINFTVSSEDQKKALELSEEIGRRLEKKIEPLSDKHYFGTLGPAEAPFFKLHNKYRYFILLRSDALKELLGAAQSVFESFDNDSRKMIAVDVHPQAMM
jgi:primosomal protein N' (replication factor Y) (superfamily II helicase)